MPDSKIVALISDPRNEGSVDVGGGREIGFSEFGPPDGRTVVWLHGTPGGRRQIPQAARAATEDLGVRIVGVNRPGIGTSTPHLYDCILDFTRDLKAVFDHLGVERAAIVGLSGGGPYALATAYAFPEIVAAAGILGGVAPTRGADAASGGPVSLAVRAAPLLEVIRVPMAAFVTALVKVLTPLASPAFDLYARFAPEGDKKVFEQPEIKAMFLDDLIHNSRIRIHAPVLDAILFTRHWGFALKDIAVPVHWWHGDADNFVPLDHALHVSSIIPSCTLEVRPGESHLGGMGAAVEVLETVLSTWDGGSVEVGAAL